MLELRGNFKDVVHTNSYYALECAFQAPFKSVFNTKDFHPISEKVIGSS